MVLLGTDSLHVDRFSFLPAAHLQPLFLYFLAQLENPFNEILDRRRSLTMYTQYSESDRDQNKPIDDKMQDDPRPGIFEPLRNEWDRQADR